MLTQGDKDGQTYDERSVNQGRGSSIDMMKMKTTIREELGLVVRGESIAVRKSLMALVHFTFHFL